MSGAASLKRLSLFGQLLATALFILGRNSSPNQALLCGVHQVLRFQFGIPVMLQLRAATCLKQSYLAVHGVQTVGQESTQGRQGRILVVVVVMTTWLRVGVESN